MAKQQQQTHQQQRMADEFTEKLSPSRIHWAAANNLFNFQPAKKERIPRRQKLRLTR